MNPTTTPTTTTPTPTIPTGRTFPRRNQVETADDAGTTTVKPCYFSSGRTVNEILGAQKSGAYTAPPAEPRKAGFLDLLVVENFIARVRYTLDAGLEEAGRKGDAQLVAKIKLRSYALDEFTRLVLPEIRAAFDDDTAILNPVAVIEAFLSRLG